MKARTISGMQIKNLSVWARYQSSMLLLPLSQQPFLIPTDLTKWCTSLKDGNVQPISNTLASREFDGDANFER